MLHLHYIVFTKLWTLYFCLVINISQLPTQCAKYQTPSHSRWLKGHNLHNARVSWFLEWWVDRCYEKSSGGKIKMGTHFPDWPTGQNRLVINPPFKESTDCRLIAGRRGPQKLGFIWSLNPPSCTSWKNGHSFFKFSHTEIKFPWINKEKFIWRLRQITQLSQKLIHTQPNMDSVMKNKVLTVNVRENKWNIPVFEHAWKFSQGSRLVFQSVVFQPIFATLNMYLSIL